MRTLDRYIAESFLRSLALAVVGLGLFYFFQALLSDLTDKPYPAQQLLFFHLLQLPAILVQLAPPAVMIASVFTVSGFNRTNELTAIFSIGVGLTRVAAIILVLAVLFGGVLWVMEDRILPPIFRKRTEFYWREMRKRKDFFLDFKQDKIWYRSKNLIYNLRSFDRETQTIRGMAVYTFDENFHLVQMTEAEEAAFGPRGWKLKRGTVTVFSREDPFPLTQPFAEKELLIAETPQDFQEIEKEVGGLGTRQLAAYIRRSRAAGVNTKRFEVKYHSRWSVGVVPVVMALLGIPFAVRGRREGGLARDLGACLAVTFFYWLFYSVSLSLGTKGSLPAWLSAWSPTLIFGSLAGLLIARKRAAG